MTRIESPNDNVRPAAIALSGDPRDVGARIAKNRQNAAVDSEIGLGRSGLPPTEGRAGYPRSCAQLIDANSGCAGQALHVRGRENGLHPADPVCSFAHESRALLQTAPGTNVCNDAQMDDLEAEQRIARAIWDEALRVTGLLPSQLARKAGLSHSTSTRFLKDPGKIVSSGKTLIKVARAINGELVILTGEIGELVRMWRELPDPLKSTALDLMRSLVRSTQAAISSDPPPQPAPAPARRRAKGGRW